MNELCGDHYSLSAHCASVESIEIRSLISLDCCYMSFLRLYVSWKHVIGHMQISFASSKHLIIFHLYHKHYDSCTASER